MSRYAARKDAAHLPIVSELELNGIVVFDVSRAAGVGFDIVCYVPFADRWLPMELKTPAPPKTTRVYRSTKRTRQSNLTTAETKAQSRAPIPVVETFAEAWAMIAALPLSRNEAR